MVLASRSGGVIASRAGAACNKGNPPCIGVGRMRKLAKPVVAAATPAHYTPKTCCGCMGSRGPLPTMRKREMRRDSQSYTSGEVFIDATVHADST